MILEISPKKIFNMHIAFIILLLLVNSIGIVLKLYLDQDTIYGLTFLFDFNEEKSIPTLFSSIMLIVCSALLYIIAICHKKMKSSYIPWLGLSLLFLFLSIDEIAMIHERLTPHTRNVFETSGFLYYAWVIPYGAALIIFIAVYSKFLLNLPKKVMGLFFLSGFIFVSGAIGFEMLGSKLAETPENNKILLSSILYTCEELLEMLGAAVFLYALLTYIVSEFDALRITIGNKRLSKQ